jgi:hypothetical protein
LTGQFAFTGSAFDHFEVVTFTNGVQSTASGEFNGLTVEFGLQTDGGSTTNNIEVEEANFPTSATSIGAATVPISLNTLYDFELVKSGNDLSVYFNDDPTAIITAASTYTNVGPDLAMYNREGAGAGSSISAGSQVQLNDISVQSVPEPASFSLILSIAAIAFTLISRKSKNTTVKL